MMNDGQFLLIITVAISVIVMLLPWLFSALKESGRIHMRRRSSAFRQFPLNDREEE